MSHSTSIALAFASLLLLAAHMLYVGLPYLIHYYDNLVRENHQRPSVRGYLRAFAVEWWFTLATNVSYPFGILGGGLRERFEPDGGPPIVLVHGFMMNRSSFFAIYWRLRRLGYRNIYILNSRPLLAPIAQQAEAVAGMLRTISSMADGAPLIAIGHSQGGIVLRWITTRMDNVPIQKLITLGAPHQGTRMAYFGLGPNARELRPNSPVFEELGDAPPGMVSMWSDLDQIITPAESARFGERTYFFAETGHHAFLYRTAVFKAVADELGEMSQAGHPVDQTSY